MSLLDQKFDHLVRQVYIWDVLWVLLLICDDLVVEVVDDHVHDEDGLVVEILLRNVGYSLFELSPPLFLDVQGLRLVLGWLQVLLEEGLQLLAVVRLAQSLLLDGWEILEVVLGDADILLVVLREGATGAIHLL